MPSNAHNKLHGRIAPKSGITINRKLDVRAGVIDSDYQCNVIITMHNIGNEVQTIDKGTKVAQLIIERIVNVDVHETEEVTNID